ncbi:MAG TPA: histidine phosphatase family protein [Solirubrobacterales bacterium]|jgi:probable phosphoglycerate mutase|nr:histidine phosphatase family protein [Solirubrobacterales bacterium]
MADRDSFEQTPYELPPGATEIVMVRHGASSPPIEGIPNPLVGGHSNPALAEAGKAQAELVAEGLRNEPISAIFVSTLRRTAETAAPLAAATGLAPVPISELREVFLGDFEGGVYRIKTAEGDPTIKRVFETEAWSAIPNAETFEEFGPRITAGVEEMVRQVGPDRAAVAVLHGAVIGQLCRQATDSRAFAFVHADNGSVSRLIVNADGRWLLRSFNDISHLRVRAGATG